jgi:peptidoglycan L-alanyl-D-glutamate endopeptidase CwlK
MSTVLRLRNTGPEVIELQKALEKAGFDPHGVDGTFGTDTEAAVRAFQRQEGLVEDGVVGRATAAKLGLGFPEGPSVIPQVTEYIVMSLFPGERAHNNIKIYLKPVLDALDAAGLFDKTMVLMALATIRVESSTFAPIDEEVYRDTATRKGNTSAHGQPFDNYDNRSALGNVNPGDGARYHGRGFIQLTGRSNYAHYGEALSVDLLDKPELALDPVIAAKVLAQYLLENERRIREALASEDLAHARAVVNGGDNGLAVFSAAFQQGLQLIPNAPVSTAEVISA